LKYLCAVYIHGLIDGLLPYKQFSGEIFVIVFGLVVCLIATLATIFKYYDMFWITCLRSECFNFPAIIKR